MFLMTCSPSPYVYLSRRMTGPLTFITLEAWSSRLLSPPLHRKPAGIYCAAVSHRHIRRDAEISMPPPLWTARRHY
jgi:hypothetical protein